MLQKPTKQVSAFAAESWESAESKFTSTCTGKKSRCIREALARDRELRQIKEEKRKEELERAREKE